MSDWLHNLPIVWMGLLVFVCTYILTGAIYAAVVGLAVDGRGRSFKSVSPGLLPPLGIMFALFVAFTASQVWNDNNRAQTAVDHEASALKTIVVLSKSFSGDTEARLRDLIRDHIMGHSNKRVDALAPGERHSKHYATRSRRRAAVCARTNTEYRRSKNGAAGNRHGD